MNSLPTLHHRQGRQPFRPHADNSNPALLSELWKGICNLHRTCLSIPLHNHKSKIHFQLPPALRLVRQLTQGIIKDSPDSPDFPISFHLQVIPERGSMDECNLLNPCGGNGRQDVCFPSTWTRRRYL